MGTEALQTQTPEQLTPSAQEITGAFRDAHREIYSLIFDPEFIAACKKNAIDPDGDMNSPAYWQQVARTAGEQVDKTRATDGNTLQLSAFELLALTPDYLFKQTALNNHSYRDPQARYEARQTVSYFNSLLRIFASEFQETRASNLERGLLTMVSTAIEDRTMRQSAAHDLHETIRGAQHELAFWQILHHTGRNFAAASLEDDLKGVDYVVDGYGGKRLFVDVKASLTEIEKQGAANRAFACKPDGKIVIFSLIKDHELHDTFFISDSAAMEKAPMLNQFLLMAQREIEAA